MLMASMLFVGCNQNKDAGQDANNKTEQTEEVKDKKSEKLDDKTVAIVDGEKISKDDYKDELSFYASMLASQQQLKNSIVTMMVQDKLIANDIKKNDIKHTGLSILEQKLFCTFYTRQSNADVFFTCIILKFTFYILSLCFLIFNYCNSYYHLLFHSEIIAL